MIDEQSYNIALNNIQKWITEQGHPKIRYEDNQSQFVTDFNCGYAQALRDIEQRIRYLKFRMKKLKW